jgi:hypothetical protein
MLPAVAPVVIITSVRSSRPKFSIAFFRLSKFASSSPNVKGLPSAHLKYIVTAIYYRNLNYL